MSEISPEPASQAEGEGDKWREEVLTQAREALPIFNAICDFMKSP